MKLLKHKSDDGRVVTIYMPEKFNFQMHAEFKEMYQEEKQSNSVVLDMNKTQYMDSAALGMMLQLKEFADSQNSKVSIANANKNIMQIMQIAHFDKLFTIK